MFLEKRQQVAKELTARWVGFDEGRGLRMEGPAGSLKHGILSLPPPPTNEKEQTIKGAEEDFSE